MTRKELAKAIYEWLDRSEAEDGVGAPPYTFNADAKNLEIGVDGHLNCNKMADGIFQSLGLLDEGRGPKVRGTKSITRW